MLEALAMASLQSGEEVFACLQNLDLFAEHVQNVPPMCLKHLSGNQVNFLWFFTLFITSVEVTLELFID